LKNFLRSHAIYSLVAIFVLLSVVTTQVGTAQVANTNTVPDVVATQMYDNFESYGNTLPVTNWPNPGGYMIDPWGDPNSGFFPSLSTDYKADGNYSMRLDYNLEDKGWNSMGHLLDYPDWSAWDGVRYWVKPDGSGRTLSFSFLEHVGSDGIKHFHSADYQMTDTTPVVVTIPWSGLGASQANVWGVEEQIWSVKGTPGPGTIYVDKIELIKMASPLYNMVITPASSTSAWNRNIRVANASQSAWNHPPGNALDGDLTTNWQTGSSQTSGQWFALDLGNTQSFNQIVLGQTGVQNDYPRSYQVQVSSDGTNWSAPVVKGSGTAGANTTISFSPQSARYISITQTGSNASYWWSIAEINTYLASKGS